MTLGASSRAHETPFSYTERSSTTPSSSSYDSVFRSTVKSPEALSAVGTIDSCPAFRGLSNPYVTKSTTDGFSPNGNHGMLSTLFGSPTAVHMVSGAIAGGISRTTTAPLDRLKVVLQVTRSSQRVAALETLRRLTREEGYLSLFRGNGANCVKVIPECAIKFVAYDFLKRKLITARHSAEAEATTFHGHPSLHDALETEAAVPLSLAEKLLAGGCAGAVSQIVVYPLEVVKTRLATAKTQAYRGILDCVTKTFRQEGLRAFYRGFCPSILGIIPYAGIDLACFETLKREYRLRSMKYTHEDDFPISILLCSGAVSSAFGQIVAYPLALVRTRLQADGINGEPRHFSGACDVFRRTVQMEGITALYRGLVPNLLKAVPAVSITWAVYETCKHALHERYGIHSCDSNLNPRGR